MRRAQRHRRTTAMAEVGKTAVATVCRNSFPGRDDGLAFSILCRERTRTMTSPSDITLMLTSDGLEWGKYISDRLKGFPRITCDSLVLDDQEYENPPEVTLACCHSTVVLLLATPQMLVYLQDKAGWFSGCLQDAPATSALAIILLLDRQDIDDVTKDSYVTSEWTYFDPGHDVKDVQQMLAHVLDMVDRCRLAKEKAERAKTEEMWQSPPPPTIPRPANPLVGLFPSTVYEGGCSVAVVFRQEVQGDVTLKVEQTDLQLTTTRETATVFTFVAPQLAPGTYRVQVLVDSKPRCRPKLTWRGPDMAAFTSPRYLAQALELSDPQELDLRLKDAFNKSVPADRGLDDVFARLPAPDLAELLQNSDTQFPTLLHYAAAYGMLEFCAALLECPGSSRAYRIRNSDGLSPVELAAQGGFGELENYIIDFMDLQTANEIYGQYIAMNRPSSQQEPGDDYEDMTQLYPDSRVPSEPFPRGPATPQLPPRTDAPAAALSSSAEPEPGVSPAGRPDRPPRPPPRTRRAGQTRVMSERDLRSSSSLHTVRESYTKASTLPPGSRLDPKAFMGMDTSDSAFKPQLPAGALGSRSQSELIEVQEMVKSQEINLNEAQMLYNAWQHRYGRNTATSFKDRQKELSDIKKKYALVRKEQAKQGAQSESFLTRLRLGGRHTRQTIQLDISEPVLQRESKKGTKVFSKSASAGQLPLSAVERVSTASTASTASSGCSSRDSGLSQGSRDSCLSGTSEPGGAADSGGDDVFGHEDCVRRRRVSTSSLRNRLSLGDLFLQEKLESSGSAKPPPPLPPRTNCPPLQSHPARSGSLSGNK